MRPTHAILAAPRMPNFRALGVFGTSEGEDICQFRATKPRSEAICKQCPVKPSIVDFDLPFVHGKSVCFIFRGYGQFECYTRPLCTVAPSWPFRRSHSFLAILNVKTFGLYYFPLERYLFLHNYIFAVYGLAQQQ